MRGSLALRALGLDALHGGRVDSEAGAKSEVSLIGLREPDPSAAALLEGFQDLTGGLDGAVGKPERAGEDVGAAAGNDGEVRKVRPRAIAQQAVDDLVDRAITTQSDHQVAARLSGLDRELDGVATTLRLEDVDMQVGAQSSGEDITGTSCRSGGVRVDNQHRSHEQMLPSAVALNSGDMPHARRRPPDGPQQPPADAPVRSGAAAAAAASIGVQALGLVVAGAFLMIRALWPDAHHRGSTEVLGALSLVAGVGVAFMARAVLRGNRRVRAPLLVLEIICLPIAVTTIQGGRWYVGVPLGVLALAAMVLLGKAGFLGPDSE
jgi:hypothetical protein